MPNSKLSSLFPENKNTRLLYQSGLAQFLVSMLLGVSGDGLCSACLTSLYKLVVASAEDVFVEMEWCWEEFYCSSCSDSPRCGYIELITSIFLPGRYHIT